MNKAKFLKFFIPLVLLIITEILFLNKNYNNHYITLKGDIYGTFYSIKYRSHTNFQEGIDSIFSSIDNAVSYFNPTSEISIFNKNGQFLHPSKIFLEQLNRARFYYQKTQGAFEPTLSPIIEAWGFGFRAGNKPTPSQVDSLLNLVSFEKNIYFNDTVVKAVKKNTTINLTAMGEGFTIDKIAKYLDTKKIQDYKVEIGGEIKCHGVNEKGEIWRIGIENPNFSLGKEENRILKIVKLDDAAISTSGSYRKFYLDSTGRRRPHIIDPKTGYPVSHNLLSASIKCKSAEKADAMATACMVLGLRKSIDLIKADSGLEGFLIYDDETNTLDTWKSENF
ncbi:FAD:protein FMN transferase [Christiangramia fulva]|uniref:FAD:protein FMN transferase n=1 Tax=Christiangramia fulva TaxID=2126553 RepID=A0A2R3Z4I5_9FLAO|nr:FAD:protein FMN transferase [Christiangramia fulva]AVR45186.1 FAD:protein FMN transferase [Christiangramia fulva]